jgi:hypothetical protein
LVTEIVLDGGLGPPVKPLKVKFDGLVFKMGGGGLTTKLTGTDWGEFTACAEVTVMVALYVPGVRPVVETLTVTVPGAAPDRGVSVSQGWLSLTAKFSVPAPTLLTASVLDAGAGVVWAQLKLRLEGVKPRVGGRTTSTTGTKRVS